MTSSKKARWAADYSLIALVIITLISVYAVVSDWDRQAMEEDHAIDIQLALAQERGEAEREWSEKVARAYEQGQRDAMTSLRAQDAMSVAQVCQAWRHRDHDADAPSALADTAVSNNRAGG